MRAREKFERKDSLDNSVTFGSTFCVKKSSIDFFSDKYNLRKVKRDFSWDFMDVGGSYSHSKRATTNSFNYIAAVNSS